MSFNNILPPLSISTKNKKRRIKDSRKGFKNLAKKEILLVCRKNHRVLTSLLKGLSLKRLVELQRRVDGHYKANTVDIFFVFADIIINFQREPLTPFNRSISSLISFLPNLKTMIKLSIKKRQLEQ